MSLSVKAEQYFYSINSLAQRIGEDITATKEAYEGLWNTLSTTERNQAINETIIQPEVALKYARKKFEITKEVPEWYPKLRIQTGTKYVIDETGSTLRWRDEHSAPFSFMTQSQMNLDLADPNEELRAKSCRAQFGESPCFSSPMKSHRNDSSPLKDDFNSSCIVSRFRTDRFSGHDNSSKNDIDDESSDNIFAKLIDKTSLLKLRSDVDDDTESLVRGTDSDTEKNPSTLVVVSRSKSGDIDESTALLETPSSYGSFRSHLNHDDEEEEGKKTIPKTGFEFLDNW